MQVERFLEPERFSHITHLVSEVAGELRDGVTPFDLLRATFPAGTVSGAPKVRAMQIISELEGYRRGPYAGAVLYALPGGPLDACIAIRTSSCTTGVALLQAGAGIVADSDPTRRARGVPAQARRARGRDRPGGGRQMTANVLLIDNYDSFTYNLAHLFGELGAEVVVRRNDEITVDGGGARSRRRTSSSRPGPAGRRTRASRRRWCARSPAACRCSASASATRRSSTSSAARSARRTQLVHGKATDVHHDGRGLFAGLPQDFPAGRYHSLAATSIPDSLEVSATAADGEVMAVRHRELAVDGVQFHPESVLTPSGLELAKNFLETRVIQQALAQLLDGRDLSRDEARGVMNTIMAGEATPAQIGGFLVALRLKGETADEIAGCAEAMREHVLRIRPARDDLVDTAGTGGDGANTWNISTAAALVAAAAGAGVAKHGNRAASSATGAADVLEALGFDLAMAPERIEQSIDELGFGFLFAQAHHPAMKYAAPVRRELAARTVFNVLGPLTNPAGARAQVVGVYDPGIARTIADALVRLDARRAYVVHGADGIDELSPAGPNLVCEVDGGQRARVRARPARPRHPALRPGRAARRRAGRERAARCARCSPARRAATARRCS